nr:glycosyltransferase family 39 protein [Micromonospora sp. DSM 115978]
MAANIDGVAGAYYLLMHGWIALFGDSVAVLRLPAALAMAGTAGLTVRLGTRLFDTRTGLLAGLLFALAPSTSRYGQEARPYALATLFAVLATLALVRALDRPTTRRWLDYAAAVAGLGLAHLVALTLLAGHTVAVLTTWRVTGDRRLLRWPLALLPAALALAPLAALGRAQQARQLAWVDPPTWLDLARLPATVVGSGPVGGMLLGLAAIGAATRGRRGAALACGVLLPATLLYAGGLLTPLWVPRYLVFVIPFGCLLAATALGRLRPAAALPILALVGLLGAPEQAALRRTHESPRSAPIDHPAAARIIAEHQLPGDGIVYAPRDGWALLDVATAYHLRDGRPRDVLAVRDQRDRADFWVTPCPEPVRCLAGVDRVWLLVKGDPADPLTALPADQAAALRDGFPAHRVWTVPGLTVALLRR